MFLLNQEQAKKYNSEIEAAFAAASPCAGELFPEVLLLAAPALAGSLGVFIAEK